MSTETFLLRKKLILGFNIEYHARMNKHASIWANHFLSKLIYASLRNEKKDSSTVTSR